MPLTSQRVLQDRMLQVLLANHGAMQRSAVLTAMDAKYGQYWTFEDTQSPATRREANWRNRASFERAAMVRAGLLEDRADGTWALTQSGRALAQTSQEAGIDHLQAEFSRRERMWQQVQQSARADAVPTGTVNSLRLFRGGRGIYTDSETTQGLVGEHSITVSFLHNGRSYADELSAGGVRYHYPATSRPGRDEAEIAASKAAYRTALPVFVVTAGPSAATRTVIRGYIEDYDDDLKTFLVTFTDGELPPPPPDAAPFSLTSESDDYVWSKRRARPNQERFAFGVYGRYGAGCAVCSVKIPQMLNAAHLRAKKDRGSDDPGNGLPLCANHHLALDAGLWSITPTTTIVSKAAGPNLAQLGIDRHDLTHLAALPNEAALRYISARWNATQSDAQPR